MWNAFCNFFAKIKVEKLKVDSREWKIQNQLFNLLYFCKTIPATCTVLIFAHSNSKVSPDKPKPSNITVIKLLPYNDIEIIDARKRQINFSIRLKLSLETYFTNSLFDVKI